jgi:hypothetical protein
MEIKEINPMKDIDNRVEHPNIWLDKTAHAISKTISFAVEELKKDNYVEALSILNQIRNYVDGIRDGNRFMRAYDKLKKF